MVNDALLFDLLSNFRFDEDQKRLINLETGHYFKAADLNMINRTIHEGIFVFYIYTRFWNENMRYEIKNKKKDKYFNNMRFYYDGPKEDLNHDDPIIQKNRKKIIKFKK